MLSPSFPDKTALASRIDQRDEAEFVVGGDDASPCSSACCFKQAELTTAPTSSKKNLSSTGSISSERALGSGQSVQTHPMFGGRLKMRYGPSLQLQAYHPIEDDYDYSIGGTECFSQRRL